MRLMATASGQNRMPTMMEKYWSSSHKPCSCTLHLMTTVIFRFCYDGLRQRPARIEAQEMKAKEEHDSIFFHEIGLDAFIQIVFLQRLHFRFALIIRSFDWRLKKIASAHGENLRRSYKQTAENCTYNLNDSYARYYTLKYYRIPKTVKTTFAMKRALVCWFETNLDHELLYEVHNW